MTDLLRTLIKASRDDVMAVVQYLVAENAVMRSTTRNISCGACFMTTAINFHSNRLRNLVVV